jgi:hypothetical protein
MFEISIAKDFSDSPGARFIHEGIYSGEEFRNNLLVPEYLKAKEMKQKLLIDLDGAFGYATSFLHEAFGGLAQIYGKEDVLSHIMIKSDDQPELIEEILGYINHC